MFGDVTALQNKKPLGVVKQKEEQEVVGGGAQEGENKGFMQLRDVT